MKYLEGLNTAQKEAVLAIDGPLLVLAGAGAGKTRVIAHRILHIVKSGVDPRSVLAITFTNKAAAEMRERVSALLQSQGDLAPGVPSSTRGESTRGGPFISTFHSLGLTLLKEHAKLLGYKRTPTIYDRPDSLRVIKSALKTVAGEDIEPRVALGVISRMKGDGIAQSDYAAGAQYSRERDIARAWERYDRDLREDQALDFDDLLVKAVELLDRYPEVRARYQHRWRYIHIDEYQDTNVIQAKMAELLVGPEKNLCVVGDVDQTIYGWRGAQIENMLQFERQYGAKVVLLEENYRSTKAILAAANHLIGHNTNRPEKNLFTKNQDGEPLSLYIAGDGGDEALFVARKIQELMKNQVQPQDIAVLYRANFQSRAIEEKLLDANVPYQVLGTRFFDRKEVKDVLSFIRSAVQENAADLGRVIDTMPGMGNVTKLKILSGQEQTLNGKMRERVAGLRELLARIRDAAVRIPTSKVVRFVITESGLEEKLKADKLEGPERLENLSELVSLASRYDQLAPPEGLEAFLESAALASDQDEMKEERNQVRLMTIHAAKGLEFPYVFIVGLEEGLFPYEREDDRSGASLEEERRLMYVALTRAEKKVFLSYAMMRTIFGNTDMRQNSRFLQELPGELLEAVDPERLAPKKTGYLDDIDY
jgi:DNA helicase II / ATP-dependent DNA helicase PcrA